MAREHLRTDRPQIDSPLFLQRSYLKMVSKPNKSGVRRSRGRGLRDTDFGHLFHQQSVK